MFHGLDARNQADHDEEEMKLAVSYSADKERGELAGDNWVSIASMLTSVVPK